MMRVQERKRDMTPERLDILLAALKHPQNVGDTVRLIKALRAVNCNVCLVKKGDGSRQIHIWDERTKDTLKIVEETESRKIGFDLVERAMLERSWEWGRFRTQNK